VGESEGGSVMGWPQVTIIVLVAMSLGINLALHSKPRTGNYGVGVGLLSAALTLVPLYYGGFFA
jgi:hypothetical protein